MYPSRIISMINTAILEHAIKLCIASVSISKEKPVSLIILAPFEHGKTNLLEKFSKIETSFYTTDFNSFIFSDFVNQYQSDKKKTIIIPDFLKIVKKKYSTQSNALTTINAITEEGWIGKLPNGQTIDKSIIANVITALTESELKDQRHKWTQLGFLSRFVPLSFAYYDATKKQIREYIKNRMYHKDEPYKFTLPKEQVDITLPKDIADKIEQITLTVTQDKNILGFRLQRQLQTMAMANALLNQRNMVTDDDYNVIKTISEHINFNFKKI